MKNILQFSLVRVAEDKIKLTAAIGDSTYIGYLTDAEVEGYKALLGEWDTPEGVHTISSPRIEIELETV